MFKNKWEFFNAMDRWNESERFKSSPPDCTNENFLIIEKESAETIIPWAMEYMAAWPCWQILAVLSHFSGVEPPEEIRGKFNHQMVFWIDWYKNRGK